MSKHTAVSSLLTTLMLDLCCTFINKQKKPHQTNVAEQAAEHTDSQAENAAGAPDMAQADELRALRPYPRGVTHLWLTLRTNFFFLKVCLQAHLCLRFQRHIVNIGSPDRKHENI